MAQIEGFIRILTDKVNALEEIVAQIADQEIDAQTSVFEAVANVTTTVEEGKPVLFTNATVVDQSEGDVELGPNGVFTLDAGCYLLDFAVNSATATDAVDVLVDGIAMYTAEKTGNHVLEVFDTTRIQLVADPTVTGADTTTVDIRFVRIGCAYKKIPVKRKKFNKCHPKCNCEF